MHYYLIIRNNNLLTMIIDNISVQHANHNCYKIEVASLKYSICVIQAPKSTKDSKLWINHPRLNYHSRRPEMPRQRTGREVAVSSSAERTGLCCNTRRSAPKVLLCAVGGGLDGRRWDPPAPDEEEKSPESRRLLLQARVKATAQIIGLRRLVPITIRKSPRSRSRSDFRCQR